MKKLILFIFFVSLYATIYSQDQDFNKNIMIGVYTNIGINQPVRLTSLPETVIDGSYYGKGSYSAGVKFSRWLSKKTKIELAACYTDHKVKFKPDFYNPQGNIYGETFETFTIPISLKRYLKNNCFLSFGSVIDIGLPRRYYDFTDTQTGFGLSLGAGKEISISNLTLDIAPTLEIHSVLPFSSVKYQQRLLVFGLRIGLNNNCQ